mgnify:FL=1
MYEEEILDDMHEDDGTMVESKKALERAVVGQKIVSMEGNTITLDSGRKVTLIGESDCCAYTDLESFLLHPDKVDHIITGVGTTGQYTEWHIYCDYGDILELQVGWSCGNPFYYGYGFTIKVQD